MDLRLLEALDSGTVVVTAHRRQARQIRFRYAAGKRRESIAAWETPRVMSYVDWLARLAEEIMWSGYSGPRTQRKLLSRFQELVLWERVLAAGQHDFGDLAGAARQARAAWGMIQAYRLPEPRKGALGNVDVAAFSDWMRDYHGRCAAKGLLDHARLADSIAPALRAGSQEPPTHLMLVGFDSFTPQQRGLLKTLENLGTRLSLFKSPRLKSAAHHVRLKDTEAEYQAAARWVRVLLNENVIGHTAVLVPNLVADRRKIERIFDDVLMPGSSLPSSSFGGRPYNVAVGPSFQNYPVVAAALTMCELVGRRVSFTQFSGFLRSPFGRAAGAEQSLRARFEWWLREQDMSTIPVDSFTTLLRLFKSQAADGEEEAVLDSVLASLAPIFARTRAEARASQWSLLFKEILEVCGWPGDTSLPSDEFQTVERFRLLLDELGALDFMSAPLTASAAVELLRRMARDVAFQPQTPELAVQLLLPEQGYGLEFDNMWVCGWHAEAWPRSAQPNPFIPLAWQRQHAMPRSSADVELAFAKRLTSGLMGGAQRIMISAARTVDERPVAMSPLLGVIPEVDAQTLELADVTDYREVIRAATELETLSDTTGPGLEGIERVRGGARVLELQAKCPFRAFAELRLYAGPLREPAPGLDARTRGMLVHLALEHIWHRFGSHEVLASVMGSEYLEVQVWEVVDRALTVADRKRVVPMPARYRQIEHQRLVRLIIDWLALELTRPPFEVASTEAERRVQIGGLDIMTRVDRIDRIADGGSAIVDYKTGKPSLSSWLAPRPDQPQLPLYAISEDSEVVAVLLGVVRPNEHRFMGLSERENAIEGVAAFDGSRDEGRHGSDWSGLLEHWRQDLDALAREYAAGEARVDPKKNACRYCHLTALCRINDEQAPAETGHG